MAPVLLLSAPTSRSPVPQRLTACLRRPWAAQRICLLSNRMVARHMPLWGDSSSGEADCTRPTELVRPRVPTMMTSQHGVLVVSTWGSMAHTGVTTNLARPPGMTDVGVSPVTR